MKEQPAKPSNPKTQVPGIDAFLPPEMAAKAETVRVSKAAMEPQKTFLLSILAGAFIAMGAIFPMESPGYWVVLSSAWD